MRQQGQGQSSRVRLEQLLAAGDTRGAVEAAKVLVREEPGEAAEALAVRAYGERVRMLIAEGLGREAAAIAAILRERFPSHLSQWTGLLEDARLAAGDFDWILSELGTASEERRAAIEERLTAWITDPSAIASASSLDADDPLAREARIVAESFEIVTSRLAEPEEMAALGEVRRRSPLASWKLLVRAIDAFHRNEDERVAANVTAIDPRSPAARAGEVLSELTTGKKMTRRSGLAERLIDRISGGRATIAAQIRSIEAASDDDDRKRLREEMRTLNRSFDQLSPYAREQVRMALLPVLGVHFSAEQFSSLFRIDEHDPAMPRYAALLMEASGMLVAADLWMAYADQLLEQKKIEPWQAAEIYLHVLSLDREDDDVFVCRDPSHGHPIPELDDAPDTSKIVEKIFASRPSPAVLSRVAPHLDRLNSSKLRRVLTAWRKADPDASEPVVRLLRLAEKEERYDEGLLLLKKSGKLKTIDPEYSRLRLRLSLRKAEQLLASKKASAASELIAEIAERTGDLNEDATTYLMALQWVAAPPWSAADLLSRLSERGVPGEVVLAEVTGALGMQFALPTTNPSPHELLEGVRRGIALLRSIGSPIRHCGWILERTVSHLGEANEAQLLPIGRIGLLLGMTELAWIATSLGLATKGTSLHRFLLLRVEILIRIRAEWNRIASVLAAARTLAHRLQDGEAIARAEEINHDFGYGRLDLSLDQDEISSIVERERAAEVPQPREKPKKTRQKKVKSIPKRERGLFDS